MPNVDLKLMRKAPMTSWSAHTGANGKAQFENLPAGRYYLEWHLEGYIDSTTTVGSRTVQIHDGGSSEEVTIELAPSTGIEGTALDENRQPMEGVIACVSGNRATTGRNGHYRLGNLGAGATQIEFLIPLEVRKKTLHRDAETGEIWGYPAVQFYPGVESRAAATPVQLAAGMDLNGLDVRLRRVHLVSFSGRTVTRPGGEALASVHVELMKSERDDPGDETLEARAVDSDGSFRFELIPPGPYLLLVYRGENGTGLPYVAPVEIGKSGTWDKEIVVPSFQAIHGVVRVKDDLTWQGHLGLAVMTELRGVQFRGLTISESGNFVLEDVPPGEWQIGMSATAVRLPDRRKLAITSARFGISNPLTGSVVVMESGNPSLEIELSSDTGRIAGTAKDAHGGTVKVERIGAPRFYAAFPGALLKEDGTFLTDELAPGSYGVEFGGTRVQVEVKSGETTMVDLQPPVR
jgi:hypothetical protein